MPTGRSACAIAAQAPDPVVPGPEPWSISTAGPVPLSRT